MRWLAIEALVTKEAGTAPDCTPPPSPPIEEGGEGSAEPGDTEVPTPYTPQSTLPPFQPNVQPPAPSTSFRRHPQRIVGTPHRTAKAVFVFASDQGGVTFLCKVDRGRFHPCGARFVRRYRLGRHVVRVKARSADGAVDATPAVYRFRVERVRHGRRQARRHGTARRRHTRHHRP